MSLIEQAEHSTDARLKVFAYRPLVNDEAVPLTCSGTDVPGPELADAIERSVITVVENLGEVPLLMEVAGMLLRMFWLGWEARNLEGDDG